MKINKINVLGDGNIVFQDVNHVSIVVNVNNQEEIDKFYQENKENISELIEYVQALKDTKTLELLRPFINEILLRTIPKFLTTIPSVDYSQVLGREKDFKEIVEKMDETDKCFLINGIGGIGKTTLAKYIVNKFKDEYDYVAWIDCSTNIKEAFVFNPDLIASLLLTEEIKDIQKSSDFIDKCFDLIINKMRRLRNKNLLIIDNAKEDIEYTKTLDKILLRPYWKVIVTSRDKLSGFYAHELSHLNEKAATDLFYLHYKYEKEDNLVNEILKIIKYHTLSIEVVAKTSEVRMFHIPEIIEILKKKDPFSHSIGTVKILHNDNLKIGEYSEYLAKMFDVSSFSAYEKWLLVQFSVLPSINIEYRNETQKNLCYFLQIAEEERLAIFPESLNKLYKFGWIEKDYYGFTMHKILQQTILYVIKPSSQDCMKLIDSFNSLLFYDPENENPIDKFQWLTFSNSILDNFSNEKNDDIGKMFLRSSGIVYFTGNYSKTIEDLSKSLAIYEELEDDLEISECYNNLATVYREICNYKEALSNFEKSYTLCVKSLGEDHEQTYIRLGNIGTVHYFMNNLDEAFHYLKKVLDFEIINFGENHPRVAISKNDLGMILLKMKKNGEAEKYLRSALSILRKEYTDNHPNTNIIRQNLALILLHSNKLEEALTTMETALKYDLEYYGNVHPEIAKRYFHLAEIYFSMNDLENAEYFAILSVNLYTSIFDTNHELTLLAKQILDLTIKKKYGN